MLNEKTNTKHQVHLRYYVKTKFNNNRKNRRRRNKGKEEKILSKITGEKFHNLKNKMPIKIQNLTEHQIG